MAGASVNSMYAGEPEPSPRTRPNLFFPVRKTPSQRDLARFVTSSTRAFRFTFDAEEALLRPLCLPLDALRSTRAATWSPSRAVFSRSGLSSSSGMESRSQPMAAAAESPFRGRKRILPDLRMRILPRTKSRRSRFRAYFPFCRQTSVPSSSSWSTRFRRSRRWRESTFRARASSDLLCGS